MTTSGTDDGPVGCPVCHSDAIHATTPLAPETDHYECERCGHTWTHSEVTQR